MKQPQAQTPSVDAVDPGGGYLVGLEGPQVFFRIVVPDDRVNPDRVAPQVNAQGRIDGAATGLGPFYFPIFHNSIVDCDFANSYVFDHGFYPCITACQV